MLLKSWFHENLFSVRANIHNFYKLTSSSFQYTMWKLQKTIKWWFIISFQRVHLDIQVGEHAINYADVAQKEKLSELQLRVRQLLDQVEQITKEQNYQRVNIIILKEKWISSSKWKIVFAFFFQYREERFRQTSESTNSRVLWWSLTQTCILIVMGAWQMRHLKGFFEAKKLV